MRKSHPLLRWARGIVGVALLGVLLSFVPIQQVLESLLSVDPAPLTLAFVVFFLGLLFLTTKLQMLLRTREPHVGFERIFRAYYIGTFFNNFLPTTVGGDVVKVRELHKDGVPGGHATAAVFMERMTGTLAVLALMLVVALLGDRAFSVLELEVFRWLALSASLLVLLVFFWIYMYGLPRIRRFLLPRGKSTFWGPFHRAAECFYVFRENTFALIFAMVIAVVFYAADALTLVLVTRAVGAEIALAVAFGIIPFVKLVETLPVTVGGLGLREGAITYCLAQFGVPAGQAASVALLLRFVSWSHSAIGAVVYCSGGRAEESHPATDGTG